MPKMQTKQISPTKQEKLDKADREQIAMLKSEVPPVKELRWDLIACIADGSEENNNSIQQALELGYEPFAVSPHVTMPQNNLMVAQPAQPKMGNMIWLKRGVMVEIKKEEVNAAP